MSEEMKLPDPGAEGSWTKVFSFKGRDYDLTLDEATLLREIKDQAEVKKPTRKAILRAAEKRLAKAGKKDLTSLNKEQQDAVRWDLFIMMVHEVIAGRELAARDESGVVEEIASSSAFR